MGYYCTVPQCTSLAGKTKNVKFHRFPRDVTMADKWNVILKRFKPYTKYSKVCSLHFTQADYNVTTMGQWKTLSKDAVPSQNLPKLNADGTVMVIRKSRTTKYRDSNPIPLNISKKEMINIEKDKWVMATPQHTPLPLSTTQESQSPSEVQDGNLNQRLQTLSTIASAIPHHAPLTATFTHKPKKQDAIMQTDPVQSEEDDSQENYEGEKSAASGAEYPYPKPTESFEAKKYDAPKDYTKSEEDFIPRTNEEYNSEAEKYALERKSHNGYDKQETYPKAVQMDGYQKMDMYSSFSEKNYPVSEKNYPISEKNYPVSEKNYPVSEKNYPVTEKNYPVSEKNYPVNEKNYPSRPESWYTNGYPDSVELLRNQQHNLQILQEQHRITENQNFFNENHIKVEIDNNEEDKFLYERTKEHLDASAIYEAGQRRLQQQRLMDHLSHQVKQEPETSQGGENVMQPQGSPYYPSNGHNTAGGYYGELARPGPELLIAKQNALAAHTQLWQNTMKRPFFYSDSPHYNSPPLLHRYEDISRILQ